MTVDIKALLAEAALPERTVVVCLRGDLVAQHEQAERELEALPAQPATLAGDPDRLALAELVADLEAQMREAEVTFRLRALPRREWAGFLAAHPPRDGDKGDAVLGINIDTGFEAVLRTCVIDPVLDAGDWTRLLDVISDGQFERLALAAWRLCRGDVEVPLSLAASTILRPSASA